MGEMKKLKYKSDTQALDKRMNSNPGKIRPEVKRMLDEKYKSAVADNEKDLYELFFEEIKKENKIVKSADLILLTMLCYDLVRLSRAQKMLTETGEIVKISTKAGLSTMTVNQLCYYINHLENQIRRNMAALGISLGEKARRQAQALSGTDFSKVLSEIGVQDGNISFEESN